MSPAERYLEPTQESGRAFVVRGIEGEVVMLNLLRFRETADYSATPELAPERPISGREAYELYMDHTLPFLLESGGSLEFVGEGGAYLIGPMDEPWDLALLVRHAGVEAFMGFARHEAYLAGMGHRLAALEDSRLLPLVPGTDQVAESRPSPAVQARLAGIAAARAEVLAELAGVTMEQGAWREQEGSWSLQEVVEHLVLAERGGIDLIWTAADSFRAGRPGWSGPSSNAGRSIEEIVADTWKPKETAPPSATPGGKGTLGSWAAHLESCEVALKRLAAHLEGLPLERVIYPHFLSGPLDALQRLDFIRFHMRYHLPQIRRIRASQGL